MEKFIYVFNEKDYLKLLNLGFTFVCKYVKIKVIGLLMEIQYILKNQKGTKKNGTEK